eukprot:IDg23206t1
MILNLYVSCRRLFKPVGRFLRLKGQLATGVSACSGRSQGPLVAFQYSYRPMLAFLPRAGRAPATVHATSNTVACDCGYYCLCTSSTYVFPAT